MPGCGLGRLVVEILRCGYACQGNEFSYHMLLTNNFILNVLNRKESVHIFPWIDNPSNVRSTADITRPVKLPDVACADLMAPNKNGDFSMCGGEFLEVYGDQVSIVVSLKPSPQDKNGAIHVVAGELGWHCDVLLY